MLPRRGTLTNDLSDLLPLSTQVLEPDVDQLERNRREVEGVDAGVKLVRAVRPVVPDVRVSVQQRRPIVHWSMCAVPVDAARAVKPEDVKATATRVRRSTKGREV